MRVPDDAGNGRAKVTIHVPDGQGLKVAPRTFVIPLDAPADKIHAASAYRK